MITSENTLTAAPATEWTGRPTRVVLGSAVALSVASGPLLLSTQGVFLLPVTTEFGWERGQFALAGLVAGIVTAFALPFVGSAIDRWGIRRVAPIGVIAMAVNVALLAFVPAALLAFVLLFGATGLTASTQNPSAFIKTISRWFDRRRGLAIGLAVCGMAIGQILIPQYAQLLVSNWGWRAAYLGLAALLLVVALPCVLLLVRDPRRGEGAQAVADPAERLAPLPGLTVRESLRTPRFWLLMFAIVVIALSIQGVLVHIIPMSIDAGWNPAAATGLLAISGAASFLGRLLGGWLYDRMHAPYVGAFFVMVASGGIVLIAVGGSPIVAVAMLGLAAGAETDLIAYLGSRYFGLRSFAQLNGYFFGAFGLSALAGSTILGMAYDAAGSYVAALWVLSGAMVAAAAAILVLPRHYTFPVA